MSTEATTSRNETIAQMETELRDLLYTVREKMQAMQSEIDHGFMLEEMALGQQMGLYGHDEGAENVEQVREAGLKLYHVGANKAKAQENINKANDAYGTLRTALGELGVIRFEK